MTERMVLRGVVSCGNSSVGAALAVATDLAYRDGDDMHPTVNVAKMNQGEPLSGDGRWSRLDRIAAILATEASINLGCPALKRRDRDRIRPAAGGSVLFVHLDGTRVIIETRKAGRKSHFMPASLLDSQFADLEPPEPDEDRLTVNIDQTLDAIVAVIVADAFGDTE